MNKIPHEDRLVCLPLTWGQEGFVPYPICVDKCLHEHNGYTMQPVDYV